MKMTDEHWMAIAISEAANAAELGEVPVGSVIINADGVELARAGNRTIIDNDPTAHAEVIALRSAARSMANYRLPGSTVYSTIEPCVMCAGALVNARVSRIVYGAADERFGAVRSRFSLCDSELLNHRLDILSGVMEEESRQLIQDFFRHRRVRI